MLTVNLGVSASWSPQALSRDCFTFHLDVSRVCQRSVFEEVWKSKSQRFEVKGSGYETKECYCRTNLYIFLLGGGGKKSVRIRIAIDTGAPIARCESDALCRTETRLTVIDYQSLL